MDHANLNASAPGSVGAISDAVHDVFRLTAASTANLAKEPAIYFSGISRDIAEAGRRLIACRSPLDLVALQQLYVAARGQAWLDGAYRCFERCVDRDEAHDEDHRLVLPE